MKILIAPDSFKDCLDALSVGKYLAEGIYQANKETDIKIIPMADGGEGFVQTMIAAMGGEIIKTRAKDPLMRETDAFYGILKDQKTAVIEMATASGIEKLKPEERNPLITTTFGTGEMMKEAMERGCIKIIVGIGGSATNDGGTGMARALGYKFMGTEDKEIPYGGGFLDEITSIDASHKDPLLEKTEVLVACDVTNPLTGPNGASAVYGPQKGASPQMVRKLDDNLKHLAFLINREMKIDVSDLPGGGAAGGLGAGLVAFADGKLMKGFDIVKEETKLEEHIQNADIVFTGEGKIDGQTIQGKTPWGVAQIAKKHNKPVIAVAGVLGDGYSNLFNEGITSAFSLPEGPVSLGKSLSDAPELLRGLGERIMRILMIH